LTISVRDFWSNTETSDSLKIEQMKWLNEIMHRVTSKIRNERLNLQKWSEESFIIMVRKYIDKCPTIASNIAWSINSSYDKVVKIES
jgi:hypothetical protein